MRKCKIIEKLSGVLIASGFLLALGTAGASDCDTITLRQIHVQIWISLLLMGMGGGLIELIHAGRRWIWWK